MLTVNCRVARAFFSDAASRSNATQTTRGLNETCITQSATITLGRPSAVTVPTTYTP